MSVCESAGACEWTDGAPVMQGYKEAEGSLALTLAGNAGSGFAA